MKTFTYPALIFFVLLSVLVSCHRSPESKFERDGISVICPAGWKMKPEEIDKSGFHLVMEKEGIDASGLIAITWVSGEVELNEWMSIYKNELQDNIVYKNSNLSFGNPVESKFAGIKTTAVTYTLSLLGHEFEGSIYFFHARRKSFAILKQQASKDKIKNDNEFQLIERSFKID